MVPAAASGLKQERPVAPRYRRAFELVRSNLMSVPGDRFVDATNGLRSYTRSRTGDLDSALVMAPGEVNDAIE